MKRIKELEDRSSDLKPCPFCGKTEPVEVDKDDECGYDQFSICCNNHKGGCGAGGGWDEDLRIAVENWNTRAQ